MNVKLGICNFCVPGWGVFAPKFVKEYGLDGMSIEFGHYTHGFPLMQRALQDAYIEAREQYGIEYPNIGCSTFDDLCFHAPKGTAEYDLCMTAWEGAIDAAAYIGIPLVFYPHFRSSFIYGPETLKVVADRYHHICDYAADKGIDVAAESVLPGEMLLDLVEMVDRDNFYLFYDNGNHHLFNGGVDSFDTLKKIYPHIGTQLHLKDNTEAGLANAICGTGIAHFQEVVDYLKEQNYEGWLILENLYELEDMKCLKKDLHELMRDDVAALKAAVL